MVSGLEIKVVAVFVISVSFTLVFFPCASWNLGCLFSLGSRYFMGASDNGAVCWPLFKFLSVLFHALIQRLNIFAFCFSFTFQACSECFPFSIYSQILKLYLN